MNRHSRGMKILELSLRRDHPPTAEVLANHLKKTLIDNNVDVSVTSEIPTNELDVSFSDCSDLFSTIPESGDNFTELLPSSMPFQSSNLEDQVTNIDNDKAISPMVQSSTPPQQFQLILQASSTPCHVPTTSILPLPPIVPMPQTQNSIIVPTTNPNESILQPESSSQNSIIMPTTNPNEPILQPESSSQNSIIMPTTNPNEPILQPESSSQNSINSQESSSQNTILASSTPPVSVQTQQFSAANTSLKRKRIGRYNWEQTKNTKKRESGEQYVGRTFNKDTGKYDKVIKEGKSLGARCSCKSDRFNCNQISDIQRNDIFKGIWEMSWSEKKVFVCSVIDVTKPVERKGDSDTRQYTFVHHLIVSGQRSRVCKQMFLSTTGLKETWVRSSLTKTAPPSELTRQSVDEPSSQDKDLDARRQCLADFLDAIPKLPSHYRRKESTKIYLEPTFQNFAEFYKEYVSFCNAKGAKHLGRTVFMEVIKSQKIAIFKPRNDRCDYCIAYENGLVDDVAFNSHREKELRARAAMEDDTKIAKCTADRMLVVTMDLQAVLQCPKLTASALYYKTKLSVHNFTVYDNVQKDVYCYVWHESEGGLSANEFASCVCDYLELRKDEFDSCILFSDGCTYQNRNKTMSKTLSYFAQKNNKMVTQKILEKGHTQMPVDSVHSAIERKLKNKAVYCPADYVRYIEEARQNPKPYKVNYLTHTFFRNFDDVSTLSSVRPGQRTGDPNVTDIRQIQYRPDGSIYYKLDFDDHQEWAPIPMKRNESALYNQEPVPLYNERLKIKATKFRDLQSLKAVLPVDYHAFYDNLPK